MKIGGKGFFIKEFEIVMFEGCVDIVVYFMKDVLVEFFEGFGFYVICEWENLFDVFVLNNYDSLDVLF